MSDLSIKVSSVSKEYRLGAIGATTLREDVNRLFRKIFRKKDKNSSAKNQKFFALKNVSLEIKKGEAVGIIGHNGAGKSTLLKLITKITSPSSGEIGINGRVASMLEVGTGFHPELTGKENIYLNGAILGMTKAEISKKFDDIVKFAEIEEFINTPVKRYSSGMYVKLAFAVAAHLDSEIMIMDEVLAVGDMKYQQKCLKKMRDAAKVDGRTVLYVSHNMSTIRSLCDRCIVLQEGEVIFDGDVEEAISVYMGATGKDFACEYDLNSAERSFVKLGSEVKLNKFTFLDKKNACFERDEKIKFSVDFTAFEELNNVRICLDIVSANEAKVGVTQVYDNLVNTKKGEKYTFNFEFDCSNLIQGDYYFTPMIYSADENLSPILYDMPITRIAFKVIGLDGKGVTLVPNVYGFVSLPPLKVIN